MRLLSLVGMNPTTIIKGGVIYEATPIGVVEQNGNALRTNEEKSDGWPTLDPAARHGLTGRFIEIIEPHTEADPVGLAIDFLVSFGSAVGPGPHAMADGSAHPARLNAILVGKTSKARKGTTRRQVARVFDRVDEVWARERTWGGLASGEGLIAAVAGESTDPRLLVVEEEISRPLAVAAREGSTLSAIIRQAWDTGNLRVMTRNQPLKASGAHVSILAHSTIEDIRRRLTKSDVMNGFANRFLFGLVRRSKLLPSGGSVPEGNLSSFVRTLRTRLTDARKVNLLSRSEAAEELWKQIYAESADHDPGGLFGAATARAEAQILRLSVAYALTDASSTIEITHLAAASALWLYCQASAEQLFGDRTGDDVEDRLLAAIKAAGVGGLAATEQYAVFGRHISASRLDQARVSLEDMDLIYTEEIPTDGRPRLVSHVREVSEESEERMEP